MQFKLLRGKWYWPIGLCKSIIKKSNSHCQLGGLVAKPVSAAFSRRKVRNTSNAG